MRASDVVLAVAVAADAEAAATGFASGTAKKDNAAADVVAATTFSGPDGFFTAAFLTLVGGAGGCESPKNAAAAEAVPDPKTTLLEGSVRAVILNYLQSL